MVELFSHNVNIVNGQEFECECKLETTLWLLLTWQYFCLIFDLFINLKVLYRQTIAY